jgi:replication factor C subunit 3/5
LTKLNEISVNEGLQLDPNAAQSIAVISNGDMRKVLNILESCSLAHTHITMKDVYDVTGRPSPMDVETIMEALNTKKFNDALNVIVDLKQQKSLAVDELIREVHKTVMLTKYTDEMKMYVISRMAEIEYRIAQGCNEKIQLTALVGAFIEVRSFKS